MKSATGGFGRVDCHNLCDNREGLIAILLHLAPRRRIILPMVQDSIHVLQVKGYKVTNPRRQVLDVIEKAQKPLSPCEIQGLLSKQGKHLNHVTIYRILDLFCRLNLAHKILSTGGFVKCDLGHKEGCHRFVVCRHCGVIQEFADSELCHEESKFAQNLGFHAEYHFSESSGLCSSCYESEENT